MVPDSDSRSAATRDAIITAAPPRPLTSFVGRADEIEEVVGLLGNHRLVTLTGVGGCGKTRLAIELLGRLAGTSPVCWVDLGQINDPASVPYAVADALSVIAVPDADPTEALTRRLRNTEMLVCLDTCEHLLSACADLAVTLLQNCPGTSILATSREPMRLAGERVWRVPSLSPDDSVELFANRASQVAGRVAPEHHHHVAEICRRLDGIPLAIELAAAWVRVLTPVQIATGLDRAFELLVGGPREALPRQQTLAASMRWSHALLNDADTAVFRRLGAFGGPFTLDAARAVCEGDDVAPSDVLPILGRLVDKSLVAKVDSAEESQLRLLDTVRQYAQELLSAAGEHDGTRDRHLAYFVGLAETAEPKLDEDQDTWRVRLEEERANIHTALDWGLNGSGARADLGRRLAAAMGRQWFISGQAHDGLAYLQRAIDMNPGEESLLQARLLTAAAMLGMVGGRRAYLAETAARAEAIGARPTTARARLMKAFHQFFIDFQRCQDYSRQARELGGDVDPFVRDWSLVLEAYSLETRDRHSECVALARRAYEGAMPRGDRSCAAFALGVEVYECVHRGEVGRACTLGREALAILAPLNDYFATGTNTANLAYAVAWAGDLDEALRLMEPIVTSLDEPDVDVVGFHVNLSQIHLFAGHVEVARRWAEQGTRLMAPDTDAWTGARCSAVLADCLRRLGRTDEALERARLGVELGRRYDSAVVLSRCLTQQARLEAERDLALAWDLQHEALAVARTVEHRTFYLECLEGLADLAARAGHAEEAVRLLASSDAARAALGVPRQPVEVPDYEALVARLRGSAAGSFHAAWADGASLTVDEAVSYAARGRGPRHRPDRGWASLTPTELDVVRLVAEGMSNPQIAARLFVSRATVKTHLSHIYAKLDVANRTELATLASSHLG